LVVVQSIEHFHADHIMYYVGCTYSLFLFFFFVDDLFTAVMVKNGGF